MNPLTGGLMKRGLPMGPNVLLTVRGRTSGMPRSAPVAIAELDGRRFVIGAYGDVQWCRNLRAAGEADVKARGHASEPARGTELDHAAARDFYARMLPTFLARLPWFGRLFGRILFSTAAPEILHDPDRAATTRPVFELFPA